MEGFIVGQNAPISTNKGLKLFVDAYLQAFNTKTKQIYDWKVTILVDLAKLYHVSRTGAHKYLMFLKMKR